MKYFCSVNQKLSESRINAIKIKYPRIKIVNGFNELINCLENSESIVFDSILELDPENSNNIETIIKNYNMLSDYAIDLIFDRSPNCDSSVLYDYLDRFYKNGIKNNKLFNELLCMQIESYINIKDAAATIKKNSQKVANMIEGKSYGRPKGTKRPTEKSKTAKEFIELNSKDFHGTLTDEECIEQCGVSRNMFYIYKRELRKERNSKN